MTPTFTTREACLFAGLLALFAALAIVDVIARPKEIR